MQIKTKSLFHVRQSKPGFQVKPIQWMPNSISLEYAHREKQDRRENTEADRNRERERMKEQLLPLLKEMVKKQLKEERDYYKSRPSLAARHYEEIFGAGLGNTLVPAITKQILTRMEERRRWDWLRKDG